MRTSLNNIKQTEDYLSGQMSAGDSLLFKAKMLIDPSLRLNVVMQQKIYLLVRLYSRQKLKSEIENVHKKIFHDPAKAAFRKEIFKYFSK